MKSTAHLREQNTMDPLSHKASLAIDVLHFVSGFSHLRPSEKDGTEVVSRVYLEEFDQISSGTLFTFFSHASDTPG
jgi:hypothetical protein